MNCLDVVLLVAEWLDDKSWLRFMATTKRLWATVDESYFVLMEIRRPLAEASLQLHHHYTRRTMFGVYMLYNESSLKRARKGENNDSRRLLKSINGTCKKVNVFIDRALKTYVHGIQYAHEPDHIEKKQLEDAAWSIGEVIGKIERHFIHPHPHQRLPKRAAVEFNYPFIYPDQWLRMDINVHCIMCGIHTAAWRPIAECDLFCAGTEYCCRCNKRYMFRVCADCRPHSFYKATAQWIETHRVEVHKSKCIHLLVYRNRNEAAAHCLQQRNGLPRSMQPDRELHTKRTWR